MTFQSGNQEEDTVRWQSAGRTKTPFSGSMRFEGITKYLSEAPVVDDFSIVIPPGEIVCLLGPSGCGKTTLLRLAAGIERPDKGRILLNDQEVSGPNRHILPEQRNIGLMFQDFALFPHMRIVENVAYGLKNLSRAEARKRAMASLEGVGLTRYAQDFPHILSGGEQQRVALARAMAPRPSVLLMDEPFSGLDPKLRENMRLETLSILQKTQATCIIVTHQPEEALRLGDRIVIMEHGRLVQVGNPQEIYHNPQALFVARMFSDLNEFTFSISDDVIDTPFGLLPASHLASDHKIIVAIRYNDIYLQEPVQTHEKTQLFRAEAKVVGSKFLGDHVSLDLAVAGLETPLKARAPQSRAPQVGETVSISVDPNDILYFRADARFSNARTTAVSV